MSKKFDTFCAEVTFNDGSVYTKVIKLSHPVFDRCREYVHIVNILRSEAFHHFDGWFVTRVYGMLSGVPHDWHLEHIPEEILDLYPHDISDILPF